MQIFLAFIVGLAFGSFLTMLIPRIKHSEKGILFGRSHCHLCKKALKILDLVPVFSFIWNKAKCRFCKKKIPFTYPVIELLTGVIFVLIYLKFGLTLLTGFYILVALILIFTFFYDLIYLEISDLILIPGIAIALIATASSQTPTISSAMIGMTIGIGFFLIQILISKGKWVGGGDIRIGAFMGAVLGWQMTIVALILSYFVGSLVSIPLLLLGKKKMGERIPLGPFLVAGTFLAIFLGEKILSSYLNLLV